MRKEEKRRKENERKKRNAESKKKGKKEGKQKLQRCKIILEFIVTSSYNSTS